MLFILMSFLNLLIFFYKLDHITKASINSSYYTDPLSQYDKLYVNVVSIATTRILKLGIEYRGVRQTEQHKREIYYFVKSFSKQCQVEVVQSSC